MTASCDPKNISSVQPVIRLVRRSWREVNKQDWDAELHRCGGSFLGSWQLLRLRRFINSIILVDFELCSPDLANWLKIGQCALTNRRTQVVLLDRIHIFPEYDQYWSACFAKLVNEFGPKTYVYGSLWNSEPQRLFESTRYFVAATPVERKFGVHLIDTKRWGSFPEYLRSVSDSVRYDYKKAKRSALQVYMYRGWPAIQHLPAIMSCRRSVIEKLGEHFRDRKPALVEVLRLACKILVLSDQSLVVLVKSGNNILASFVGVEFGGRIYHITGGTKPNRVGAGSLLMLSVIEHLFAKKQNGQLVLGACWGEKRIEDYQTGSLLYKRKLRVQLLNGIYERVSIEAPAHAHNASTSFWYRYLRPWLPIATATASALCDLA